MDHPEHIQLAIRLGHRIRQQAEALESQICCGSNMAGACGVCAYWLWRALEQIVPKQFTLVRGQVGVRVSGGHCWVEDLQGMVVDPTATQFFTAAAKIEVMSNYTAYHVRRYRSEKRGRLAIQEFPSWWESQQPARWRHKFLPLVRNLVQEELTIGYNHIITESSCPGKNESNWMSPSAARS